MVKVKSKYKLVKCMLSTQFIYYSMQFVFYCTDI